MNALRLEKDWGTWAREYRPIYGPYEAGLGRFIALKKPDFIGRDAALRERDAGPTLKLVKLVLDAADADALGDEPVRLNGKAVGWVTSGGYAHHVGASVALAYVPAALAVDGTRFTVDILGEERGAALVAAPLFDPDGLKMRG